jgi:hypothetical protein
MRSDTQSMPCGIYHPISSSRHGLSIMMGCGMRLRRRRLQLLLLLLLVLLLRPLSCVVRTDLVVDARYTTPRLSTRRAGEKMGDGLLLV